MDGHGQPIAGQSPIASARTALRRLARRAWAALVYERAATTLAALVGAAVVMTALDYFLRFPAWMRYWHLALAVVALAVVGWVWLRPAWRFGPSLTTIALRVERAHPELKGWLASALELETREQSEGAVSDALARASVAEAARRWPEGAARGMLRSRGAWVATGRLAIAAVLIATPLLLAPGAARTGAARTLAPWSGVEWPKRTDVADATTDDVHPRGAALPLRALVTRSNKPMDRTDVAVRYRLVRDGREGPTRRALMTWQRTGLAAEDPANPVGASGEVFERLVETDGEALEYRFESEDDRTQWRRVRLIEPPAVASASARIEPPSYARLIGSREGGGEADRVVELGGGFDERAVAPSSLAGSTVEMTLRLNKPVDPEAGAEGWVQRTLGRDARRAGVGVEAGASADTWTLRWTLEDSTRLVVSLVDEHGIASVEDAVFRFEAVEDGPPSAAITEPVSDETVLPTAVVEVVGEGRDDVGLAALWVEAQKQALAGETPSGPGGALEAAGEPFEVARASLATAVRSAEAPTTLDLAAQGLRAGDELWLTAIAADIYGFDTGRRDPVRSQTRRLIVISEDEFVDEVRSDLGTVRREAMRVDEQQAALEQRLRQRGPDSEARRGQAQVSERLSRQSERIEQLRERIERNGLSDAALRALLRSAQTLSRLSEQSSARASDAMDEAAREQAESGESSEAQQREAETAQDAVRDGLEDLIGLLDRGEDAWAARRRLESLLEDQQQLAEDTAQAARETAGLTPEQLSPDQRSEAQRIAERQQQLSQRASEAVGEMRQQQRELQENDPSAAAGLARAARQMEQSQVSQTMRNASGEAQQNRMATAEQMQQQAMEDLQEALEEMEQAERAREEELNRVLASLIETIRGLIRTQEQAIAGLGRAQEQNAYEGLDEGMIALNRRTAAALDEADGSGQELAPVATLLGRAGEAQTQAIVALRADPVDGERAMEGERRSLDLLTQALEEAEAAQAQAQQEQRERQRRELAKAYREALETQVSLREQTGALDQMERMGRRERAQLRGLSIDQRGIGEALEEIREKTAELSDAVVFDYAHKRLNGSIDGAAGALEDAESGAALREQGRVVALLQGLLEALREETQQEQDEGFQQGGGGGQAGGQQQQEELIPGGAQLKLLRSIQADLLERTRSAAGEQTPGGAVESLGREQRELSEVGETLIEQLQSQNRAPQQVPQPGEGGAR